MQLKDKAKYLKEESEKAEKLLAICGASLSSYAFLDSLFPEILYLDTIDQAPNLLRQKKVAVCLWEFNSTISEEVLTEAKKASPNTNHIGVCSEEVEAIVKGLHEKGIITHYFVKPLSDQLLKQCIKASIDHYSLACRNKNLEYLTEIQERTLARTHDSLRKELFIGAKVHEQLLMGQPPKDCPKVHCDAITIPSKEIEGDFFDFFNPLPWVYDLVIADVMGKGLPAALVGTAIKTQLARFATPSNRVQIFNKQLFRQKDLLTPREVMERVHEELAEQLMNMDFFASLFFGRFDLRKYVFSFVDCGFTKPLHYKHHTQEFIELRGKNFPLGMVPEDTDYKCFDVTFEKDDLFIFYSDGVTEARSRSGELYGLERLTDTLKGIINQSPAEIKKQVLDSVRQFTETQLLDDDFTLIVLKINEERDPGPKTHKTAKFYSDLSQLEAIREFVHRFCMEAPGDQELLSTQLQLAVDEAFCNIVKHSYKEVAHKSVVIEGELTSKGLILELSDQGETFSPEDIAEPSLAGDRDGGYGLYIMKEVADQVTYVPKEKEDGWNYLRLFKRYLLEEEGMKLSHSLQDNVLVINLHSENLDAKLAPSFKEEVSGIINDIDKHFVVFDLNKLQFIDSSGLGSFLSILRVLNSRGGDLKLAGMTKPIRTMFEIVRMHKLFEIFNSPEEAVRSFK